MKVSRVVFVVLLSTASLVLGRLGVNQHGKEHDETIVKEDFHDPYFDGIVNDHSPMVKGSTESIAAKVELSAVQQANSVLSAGVSRIVGGSEAGSNQFPYYSECCREEP